MGPCFPVSKPHSAHVLGTGFVFFLTTSLLMCLSSCRLLCRFLRALPFLLLMSMAKLQIAPFLFDSMVTLMTVWKAFNIRKHSSGPSSRILQTFLREGNILASNNGQIER